MDLTKNYKLKKPSADDFADIGDLNENADAIDAQMKKAEDGLAAANSAITSLQTDKADRSVATPSTDGLESKEDKAKLDGIEAGAQVNTITGIKGNAESSYRTGKVNLTAANIGALTNIKIGTVTTGSAAATASTSNTVTTLNLTIPKGDKGDTGAKGATGAQGAKGDTGATGTKGATGTRGSRWNTGTAITGTSTTATIFSGSGITDALVNDMYLNKSTGYVYRCTVAGAAAAAKWVYVGSIKGATGAQGAKGDTGATGAKGATGAAGPSGKVYHSCNQNITSDAYILYWDGISDKVQALVIVSHGSTNYISAVSYADFTSSGKTISIYSGSSSKTITLTKSSTNSRYEIKVNNCSGGRINIVWFRGDFIQN